MEKDAKRTGVKAFKAEEWSENLSVGACYILEGRLGFTCPGCGQYGSIRAGHPKPEQSPSWDIVEGTLDDPATLTLSPSINCIGCCGWHGWLRNGVFVC